MPSFNWVVVLRSFICCNHRVYIVDSLHSLTMDQDKKKCFQSRILKKSYNLFLVQKICLFSATFFENEEGRIFCWNSGNPKWKFYKIPLGNYPKIVIKNMRMTKRKKMRGYYAQLDFFSNWMNGICLTSLIWSVGTLSHFHHWHPVNWLVEFNQEKKLSVDTTVAFIWLRTKK